MIHRLDKPSSRPTFTNDVEGYPPTVSKWATPIDEIWYTPTVYTANSNGLTAYWYTNTSAPYTVAYGTAYSGNLPIAKAWYGNGLPPVFSINDVSDKWSFKARGYFRFDYAADYTFYFGGQGDITKFQIGGVNYLSANGSITEKSISILSTSYATSKAYTNATEGAWALFDIAYEQRDHYKKNNSGFCFLWQTDNSVATPEKIVVSAAITAPITGGVPATWANSIASTAVPHYSNVNLNLTDGQGSTFTFEVPFLSSSLIVSSAGYFYEPETESYRHINKDGKYSGLNLRKFRKIEYFQGYQTPIMSTAESVQRFAGQIRDFNVNLSPDGNDTLEVICHDYSILTKEQFNIDAPNPIDYVAAGYLDKVVGHVDGLVKPPTFDGWEVHKAFEILCMNSYLDPYFMSLRKRNSNRDGNLIYGNYFVEPKGLSYQIWLDRDPIKYGNPYGVEPDSEIKGATIPPDSEYLNAVGFGEFYQDTISKMAAVYGMTWGVNRNGYPFLSLPDAPRSYFNDRDVSDVTYSGQWTKTGTDVSAFKATYSTAQTVWSSVSATFTGSKVVALVGYHSTGGNHVGIDTAGQNATIFSEIRKDGVTVPNTLQWYNTYLWDEWNSYDGVHPQLGLNPCILTLGNNLTYDTYTIHIWRHNNTGTEFRFEGFLFYDEDLDGVKTSFRTSDQYAPGQVTDLSTIDTGEDIRNEAYVLGRFLSYQYDVTGVQADRNNTDVRRAVVNPRNPVGQYVQSVTRDIDSIFKSTASNFVGMPRRILIQDPSIGSQSQADYLSYNVVRRYANPGTNVTFGTLGNPLLEINDKVYITDEYSQAVDSAKSFWITGVGNGFSDSFTSNYEATTFRPIGAYFPKPQPNITDDFGGIPILNLRIENRGVVTHLEYDYAKDYSSEMWLTTVTGMAQKGYIYLQKRVKGQKVYEIIKYARRDADAQSPKRILNLTRGLQYSSAALNWLATDSKVYGAYDPYLQEGTGIVPTIKFDSLVSGKMYIRVFGDLNGFPVHVATLTGIGDQDWPYESFDGVEWSGNQVYTWDARDHIGDWNRYFVTQDGQKDMKGDVGYYVAEPKDIGDIPQVSKFYLDFQFYDNNGDVWSYSTKEGSGRLISTASVITRRGPVGKVNFHIQYDGCWYPKHQSFTEKLPEGLMSRSSALQANEYGKYSAVFSTAWSGNRFLYIADTSWSFHYMGVDEITQTPRYLRGGANRAHKYSPFYSNPHVLWSEQYPREMPMVHFTGTANGRKGLKVIVRSGGNLYNEKKDAVWPNGDNRVQEILDPDYRRFYSLGIKFRRNVIGSVFWHGGTRMFGYQRPTVRLDPCVYHGEEKTWVHEKSEGDFIVDQNIRYEFYNDGKGLLFHFNPKNLKGDESYSFPPTKGILSYFNSLTGVLSKDANGNYASRFIDGNGDGSADAATETKALYFYNFVQFYGEFIDNSGRTPTTLGDLYKNVEAVTTETLSSMLKKPGDETSAYRYDETSAPRPVGYVDLSIPTFMSQETINNLSNMLWAPSQPYGGIGNIHGENEIKNVYFPRLCSYISMWLYRRE